MKITPLHASAPCRALKGCRPCFPTKRPRSPLSRAFPARLTVWAVYLSGDDRGKRARQRGRAKSGLFQPVLFPSPRWKQPQNPSPTFARKHRAIVQKCTGQKSFRAKVRRVQRPSRPFFAVPGEDGERGFRAKVPENACGTRVLTKKNCTATLTHIVSKLPCSYGGAEGGRTPVRRPKNQSISERSLRFDIPSAELPQTGLQHQ